MFDFQKVIKQAQKLQGEMSQVQDNLEKTEFTGQAGGGSVVVVANGKFAFKSVAISPEAAGDVDMLNDLVLAALTDLSQNISREMEDKMKSLTAGMNIPGLKLPF